MVTTMVSASRTTTTRKSLPRSGPPLCKRPHGCVSKLAVPQKMPHARCELRLHPLSIWKSQFRNGAVFELFQPDSQFGSVGAGKSVSGELLTEQKWMFTRNKLLQPRPSLHQ